MAESGVLTVVLLTLPSLLILFFLPFTWNFQDSCAYFDIPITYNVPHYPALYLLFCQGFLKLFQGHIAAVYCIVFIQHIIYTGGVYYLSRLFKNSTHKNIFLALMCFNINVLSLINGIFPEGLFAAFQVVFWGAMFNFMFDKPHRKWHILIACIALFCLPATKHLGILYFGIPIVIFMGAILYKGYYKKLSQLNNYTQLVIATSATLCIYMIFNSALLWYINAPHKTLIGRQGIYRINALPFKELSEQAKSSLINHYTQNDPDTIIKQTYQLIFNTRPYNETSDSLNAYLQRIRSPHDADYYLNKAFMDYLCNFDKIAWQATLDGFRQMERFENLAPTILSNNTIDYLREVEARRFPASLRNILPKLITQAHIESVRGFINSAFLRLVVRYSIADLWACCLLLFILFFYKIGRKACLLFATGLAFVKITLLLNSLVTIFIIRYAIMPYMDTYLMLVLLTMFAFGVFKPDFKSELNKQ